MESPLGTSSRIESKHDRWKKSPSVSVTITNVKLCRHSASASGSDVFLYKHGFSDAQENKKRRRRRESCHHSVSNISHIGVTECNRGSTRRRRRHDPGGVRWSSSRRRRPAACRGSAAPAEGPLPGLSSSQFTVGTWFKLYSLALSRRLAMLLAMFIPWDVLVLEQVGG